MLRKEEVQMGAPLLEIHDLQKHFLVKKSFSAQNRVYLKAVDGVDLTMEKERQSAW